MNNFLINTFEADIACDYLNEHIGRFDRINLLNINEDEDEDETKKELIIYEKKIQDFIYRESENNKDEKEKTKGLKKEIISNRLSNDDLIWIDKKNIRLCNWLWSLIKKRRSNYRLRTINTNEIYLDRNPNTYIERYNSLIKLFNKLNISKEKKIEFINELKEIWSDDIVKYIKIKDLINENNTTQIIWAYKYIEKTFNKRLNKDIFNIDNDDDYYHIIICYFDSIENSYEKNDKFTSLKNAWSQKKYRDDNNGKKSYNFNMSIDITKKLDILSLKSNRSKSYIIEELINSEYMKLKK
ncbi:hypothetical protein VXS06_11005 [Photobacterium toruni]|uniref:Uncharacterized protein n=1 Tax=Photobacterium toruni TaxID=1935446 RepID=A0ABU6L6V7_9GAMM|nr:hypothetical protein [Photobacterium toruni]